MELEQLMVFLDHLGSSVDAIACFMYVMMCILGIMSAGSSIDINYAHSDKNYFGLVFIIYVFVFFFF
jgi:hypothetical protein